MGVYVLSDLHGRHDLFLSMLEQIHFSYEDVLYILGDVADRGPDGIKTYQHIIRQPNITLVAGNHEIMFLSAIKKAEELCGNDSFYFSQEWQLWLMNGGTATWTSYLSLPYEERMQLKEYLGNLAAVIPDLRVGRRHFYLCHSTHADRYLDSVLFCAETSSYEIAHIVWDRIYAAGLSSNADRASLTEKYHNLYTSYPKGTTMVFGHTPTIFLNKIGTDGRGRIWRGGHGHLIDIDCGCAVSRAEGAMLGCLRLDDLAEFYISGKK